MHGGMELSRWSRAALAAAVPVLLLPVASTSAQAAVTSTQVSALAATSSSNGFGPAERNSSNGQRAAGDGRVITVAGKRFSTGLGVHAPSDVRVVVPPGCGRLSGILGVDDEVGARGSVVFKVFSDGALVHTSGVLRGSSPAAQLSVAVKPARVLRLVVEPGRDGHRFDHADWAGLRLTCTTPLTRTTGPGGSARPVGAPASPAPGAGAPAARPTGIAGTWRPLFVDEFDGPGLDATKWSDHDAWQRSGWSADSAWFPVPHTSRQIEARAGVLTLKNRRAAGLPDGKRFTSAHINTKDKFSIPAGVTSFTEARIKAPSAAGTLPGFWLLGNGTSADGGGWPISGEIDILEFANSTSDRGAPYFSVWYPKDVYTRAPGTFLNGTHDSHPDTWRKRPDLLDSWHTWGLLRTPDKMELYIDGRLTATFRAGSSYRNGMPLPRMLFTNAQHLRVSLLVGGGWAGGGYAESQYGEGDLALDYVRVWVR